MAARWNAAPPNRYQDKLGTVQDRGAALTAIATYTTVAVVAAAAGRYGPPLLRWLRVPGLGYILLLLTLTTVASAAAAVLAVARWHESRRLRAAQATLKPGQRALLGLPPTPLPRPGGGDAARPVAALLTPLTPPQRPSPAVAVRPTATPPTGGYGAGGGMGAYGGASVTPQSGLLSVGDRSTGAGGGAVTAALRAATASPGSRRSPWSAGKAAVATPEQLQHYFDMFASPAQRAATAAAAAAAAAATAAAVGGAAGATTAAAPSPAAAAAAAAGGVGGYGGTAASAYGAAAAAAAAADVGGGYDQGDGAGPPLPLGRDAPLYRPSIIRRFAGAAGTSATGAAAGVAGGAPGDPLQPSADSEAATVVRDMLRLDKGAPAYTSFGDLTARTERFREWLSLQVLRPLVDALDSAHKDANALLAPLTSDRLPSLDDAVAGVGGGGGGGGGSGSSTNGSSGMAGGVGGSSGMTGGAGGGNGVGGGGDAGGNGGDADALVAHLLAMAEAGARAAAANPQQQAQLLEVYRALHRYQQLLLVLRGRRPPDLLPPAPAGYVAAAARRLARGTFLGGFEWNGGGPHAGRAWTPDLPTDSVVVFYLFAAFLDAPGWQFPLQPAPEGGRGAPLYLGRLRPRAPARYSAVLAYRPDKPGPGAAAAIGSNLSGREPRYSLLADGQVVTLEGRDAVFHTLLLFLAYHDAQREGLLGGRYLGELGGLDGVMRGTAPAPSVPQRVWDWWFARA